MAKTETEIISLYNGEVNITFYPNSHQYKIDGQKIMSPSSIVGIVDKSWPLMYWATNLARDYLLACEDRTDEEIVRACRLHTEKKDEAADIGTQAHEWIETYTRDNKISLPEDDRVMNIINQFLEREKSHKIEYIHQELVVYSKAHNYVGTLDWIAVINWKRYLLDYKTSNAVRLLEYWMQTVAYKTAYEEETWETLDWIIILKLPKEPTDKDWNPIKFEAVEIYDFDWFMQWFLACKAIKELQNKYK